VPWVGRSRFGGSLHKLCTTAAILYQSTVATSCEVLEKNHRLIFSNEGVPCVERVNMYAVVHWNPFHRNIRGKIYEAVRKKTQVYTHFENYDEPKDKLMSN